MKKADTIARMDCKAARKDGCGYYVQPSCANCVHVIHYYSLCRKHEFPVNRDHGICRDFAWPDRSSDVAKNCGAPRTSRPTTSHSSLLTPHSSKTITRRTK